MPAARRPRLAPVLHAAAFGAAALAAGCDMPPPAQTTPPPAAEAAPEPAAAPWSDESLALHDYYTRIEDGRLARGLMRRDGGGPDTPFTPAMLVENFVRVALYDEYQVAAGRVIARETPSQLRRWQGPVRMRLEFGADVPEEIVQKDRADVTAYAARLARLTGHPVSVTTGRSANFHVLVLTEAERRAAGPRLRELVPGIDDLSVRIITSMPRETFCLVIAFSRGGGSTYTDAIAVVRAEHPDLTRLSCYHEELAQGLGLPNDSPHVRPSIFNDAKEFALLTTHDEHLLRILYDPRLRNGMRAAEARPIVRQIVAELTGGES